jgi:hypothetical protein
LQDVRAVANDEVGTGSDERLGESLLAWARRGLVLAAPVDGDYDHVGPLRRRGHRLTGYFHVQGSDAVVEGQKVVDW